ncbi:MAG TPA: LytTR family DNA-binding domain-containing protein [Chryseolinea sp.]|nr:LytTR family DNA-binding domain-containing protein [Chryseolinea sp.]
MLKAVALDDEPMALEVIRQLSAKASFIELNACFTNAFEAMTYLQREKTDLLFLDIKMPDLSGIDFLRSLTNPPMVIFTTAYSEHAVQSFELDAIDYLLKPFSLARFLKACNKAHEQYELRHRSTSSPSIPSSVFIKSGYEQLRIELNDILYVESSGNYMQFVTAKQKITSRLTMSEVETLLPSSAFVRVHRSYIVARERVTKIDKNSVWIKDTEIPIGAAYVNAVEKLVK